MKKMTRIHVACKEGHLQALLPDSVDEIDYLDADFARFREKNEPYGNTPLHLAVLFEHKEIVEFISNKFTRDQFKTLLCEKNSVTDTPVHYAARNGNLA